ncbi:L,D-transpeptidase family protein [Flavobacterium zepuense]|uniref:L,D-transpeptidase family protein n=1 Tax=Flavobacterium zepuense TaxID=2593302 RepID=A0A552V5N2_9FLAO|nr:L,D-transpeptidase family protein [Flavobacterium zepuense]TRW25784.1 L,D-transpeptidase family protein [Flavobacterium zepuense]
MKRLCLLAFLIAGLQFTTISCKKENNPDVHEHSNNEKEIAIDASKFPAFFAKYPEFKPYETQINELYKKHNHYIWHEKRGFIEFAEVLYNQVNQIGTEGVVTKVPYKKEIDELFENSGRGEKPDETSELLISSMYFYYADKVLGGLNAKESKQTGWYLPRERTDYVAYLDTLMRDPKKIKGDKEEMYSGYFNLKKGLSKYRDIKKKGGWGTITLPEGTKSLKEGDDSPAVAQLRARLAAEGYLKSDSKSTEFDGELKEAISSYERMRYREFDGKVGPEIIKELNVPVADRIKTITVNMERCRWITPDIDTQKEYIVVNIPSYRLRYVRDGKIFMTSNVVVGKELNKTVVFSGQMSYLVFSPYWNVPKSILEKEIKPGIAKNKNYLADHNMEWNGNMVRQKPGGENSLGKVKFMFPNSNNIYLHDTPAKGLFNRDERAFSHGCVRVEKARDLAIAITKKDGNWSEKKVDEAMNAGKETNYALKTKIPVYIAYFTAFADENGNVGFFDDVYERDNSLANLLYKS